jgi:hypothetical protein
LREFKRVVHAPRLKESVSPATAHGGINLHFVDEDKLSTDGLSCAAERQPAVAHSRYRDQPGSRWLVRVRPARARAR